MTGLYIIFGVMALFVTIVGVLDTLGYRRRQERERAQRLH
jgi:hypothetical protein